MRPLAALAVIVGWLLRVVGVLLAIAIVGGGTYFTGTDAAWWWSVITFPLWLLAAFGGAWPVFAVGAMLLEWGDEWQRQARRPIRL
jgi:hypothetical protein